MWVELTMGGVYYQNNFTLSDIQKLSLLFSDKLSLGKINIKHSFFFFFLTSRTKIFIRFPRALFATEEAFEFRKHQLGMIFFFLP